METGKVKFNPVPSIAENEPNESPVIEIPDDHKRSRRKSVSAEKYDPETDEGYSDDKVTYPKTDEQRDSVRNAIKSIVLFRTLEPDQLQEVIDAMFEKKVNAQERIIVEGDDGDNFYVIDSGEYKVYIKEGKKDKLIVNLNSGFFGELALMYNQPRAATVIASTSGTLWALDRKTFRRIILKSAFEKRRMYEGLLETVPLLKALLPYERMNVADALVSKSCRNGECIIKQGDKADCMYFVEKGSVRIMMNQRDKSEREVKICQPGDYFGELALITNKPRAASAYSIDDTRLAVLDILAFERLLGPCMEIMKRNIDSYQFEIDRLSTD